MNVGVRCASPHGRDDFANFTGGELLTCLSGKDVCGRNRTGDRPGLWASLCTRWSRIGLGAAQPNDNRTRYGPLCEVDMCLPDLAFQALICQRVVEGLLVSMDVGFEWAGSDC